MKKLNVMTIVGTRPEIIRLSRVIPRLDEFCEHTLVHTGQNYDYELNEIFFSDLSIRKPDRFLKAAGKTSAQTIGNIISAVDQLFEESIPDAVLILGDTNSALSAIPAKRRKIPIFHMEAGNRCFDMRVPEEINRRIVDHIADINLPYSSIARSYLLNEGLSPDRIIKTGSPMFEVLNYYRPKIDQSVILNELQLKPYQYFLVSAHREENIDLPQNFERLILTLNTIANRYQIPLILSAHPRTQKQINASNTILSPLIKILKPMGFCDYNHLQLFSKAVLSDSGTINEESSILNFPALNIREAHERPEAMEEAVVMLVGLDAERVMQGLNIVEKQQRGDIRQFSAVNDYCSPNVSDKVVRIIQSYTDYVNRIVWLKT
jgi:UDP-N-acetyl-L-fucosamine synthase